MVPHRYSLFVAAGFGIGAYGLAFSIARGVFVEAGVAAAVGALLAAHGLLNGVAAAVGRGPDDLANDEDGGRSDGPDEGDAEEDHTDGDGVDGDDVDGESAPGVTPSGVELARRVPFE